MVIFHCLTCSLMQPQPLIGVLISSFKSLHYFPLLNTFPKCECFTDIFTGLGNFILLNSHSVCKVGFLFMKKGWSWGLKRFNNLLILLLNGPSWDLYLSLSTSKVYYILLKRFIYVREGGEAEGETESSSRLCAEHGSLSKLIIFIILVDRQT